MSRAERQGIGRHIYGDGRTDTRGLSPEDGYGGHCQGSLRRGGGWGGKGGGGRGGGFGRTLPPPMVPLWSFWPLGTEGAPPPKKAKFWLSASNITRGGGRGGGGPRGGR